tara:strand:+ start:836 stop:1336 length:501 start_codon:yes stop_codon:yes gene_type:complete
MIYLVLFCVVLTSIFLFLLIELKKSVHLIYIIPLSLFFILGTYFYINELFGYPAPKTHEKGFYLLQYYIDQQEENIYLWVVLKGEKVPKSLSVPYTQQDHKNLDSFNELLQQGEIIEGDFSAEKNPEFPLEHPDSANANAFGTLKSRGGEFNLMHVDINKSLPDKK